MLVAGAGQCWPSAPTTLARAGGLFVAIGFTQESLLGLRNLARLRALMTVESAGESGLLKSKLKRNLSMQRRWRSEG